MAWLPDQIASSNEANQKVERVEVTGHRYIFDPARDSLTYNDGNGFALKVEHLSDGTVICSYADGREKINPDGIPRIKLQIARAYWLMISNMIGYNNA